MQGFMTCCYKFVSKCRTLNIKKKYLKISMKYKLFTHFNTIFKKNVLVLSHVIMLKPNFLLFYFLVSKHMIVKNIQKLFRGFAFSNFNHTFSKF